MMGLTHRERDLLAFLTRFIADNSGAAPTFDEMREHMGLAAKSGVYRILTALEERGHIVRLPNRARAIEIVHQQRSELSQFSDVDIAAEYARRFMSPFQFSQSSGSHGTAPGGCAPDLNHGAPLGEVATTASPGHQMRAASTPRSPSGSCPLLSPLGHPSR